MQRRVAKECFHDFGSGMKLTMNKLDATAGQFWQAFETIKCTCILKVRRSSWELVSVPSDLHVTISGIIHLPMWSMELVKAHHTACHTERE